MNTIGFGCSWREKDSRVSTEKLNFEPPTLVGGLTNKTLFHSSVSNSNRIYWNDSPWLPVTVHPPNHVGGSWIRFVLVIVDEEKDSRVSNEQLNFEPPTIVGGLTNRTLFPSAVSKSNRKCWDVSGWLLATVHPPTDVGGSWIRLVLVVVEEKRNLASALKNWDYELVLEFFWKFLFWMQCKETESIGFLCFVKIGHIHLDLY